MSGKIVGAKVVGRAQNRTALGMIHAFAKMCNLTLEQLVEQLPRDKICPDCGAPKAFYTFEEVQTLINNGEKWFESACFTEESELIHLADGNKVALVKMWTEKSLKSLQEALAKYNITGEVNREHKGNNAKFSIYYKSIEIVEGNYDNNAQVLGAKVVGRAQNRTALGMIHAFARMRHLTLAQLVEQLPRDKICPDCGAPKAFYTFEEVQTLINNGEKWFESACFTEESELIHLADGNKVALVKMWTEKSLKSLQEALAKYDIKGEVDREHKGNAAKFSIYYECVRIYEGN